MEKLWMNTASRGGNQIRLYIASTDAAVQKDLALPKSSSLVESGRQLNHRREFTLHSDHMDFACGAFAAHAYHRKIDLGPLQLVDTIPGGLAKFWIGGDTNLDLVCLFEES